MTMLEAVTYLTVYNRQ